MECIIKTLKNATSGVLGKKTRVVKKLWITEEFLELIDVRIKYKNARKENGVRNTLKNKECN